MQPTKTRRPPYDTESAAAYTGFTKGYLTKFRTLGGGPTFIKIGGQVRYDPDDLDAWLDSHKRISTSGEFKGTGRGRKPASKTPEAA
jgi:hypothetical protein